MDEIDETRRLRAGASDGVDQREILGEQRPADDDSRGRSVTLGEFERGAGKRLRPHVVGRRVDEIAPHDDGADDPREAGGVDAFGRAKPRALGLWRDITRKAIARQKEGQRRRLRVRGRAVEAIDAGRQQRRELAREERVALARSMRLDAEQHALQRAVFAGLQQRLAGLRLEPASPREGARALGQSRRIAFPVPRVDEINRDRLARSFVQTDIDSHFASSRFRRRRLELGRTPPLVKPPLGLTLYCST